MASTHDDHHHDHAHGDHAPGRGHAHHGPNTSAQRLGWALAVLLAFTLLEALGGWWSNSLALLSDAVHMAADSAALGLALFAQRIATRPANARLSYGWQRSPALAAFVNGLALLALTVWVVAEAALRLLKPEAVQADWMLAIALAGGVANVAVFLVLSGGASLNERGARAHVLGDLLGSGAAVLAAVIILATGRTVADPLLSLFVSAMILRTGWAITRDSAHVLLEGTPAGFDEAAVREELAELPDITGVHHVHAWSLSGEQTLVTLHAQLRDGADADATLRAIHHRLRDHLDIAHATVQLECGDCADAPRGDPTHGCIPAPGAAHGITANHLHGHAH
ncbi:MAG: cation transporter [Betaproteobacteria bacterium]|nr:cation transporter [Betaproteobacteria bacterium]MDE2123078.1 cation transporter [Betaproteobacteria bacterium]MDE2186022.1 cation transporter [Betaproteobacteria bacterium]MDE2325800.1 cation transporter [Betaproteobacteria bacterium]